MPERPYAVFSCDLRHLEGYGFDDVGPCDRICRTAVPRLLDLFAELGVPGVDARMDRHPGMKVPLATKRADLRDVLTTIARERRVVTSRQALEEGLAA